MRPKTQRLILNIIRFILAGVFLLSGIGKLISDGDARYLVELLATHFYWLVEYTGPIVTAISALELLLAVMLLWGKKLRWTFTASILLILVFSSILGFFYVQGMNIKSCGCFGALGIGGGLFTSLLKNVVLLILLVTGFTLATFNELPVPQHKR